MTATHRLSQHNPHIHKLSLRLQAEVDMILGKVNDKELYSEFHEKEIMEINDGIHTEVVRELIDERIAARINNPKRPAKYFASHSSQSQTKKKWHHKLNSVIQLLFKQFYI